MADKPDKGPEIPESLKITVGRLMIAISGEADPAKKIHLTSSLISEIRSGMKIIIRYWKLESTETLLWNCLRSMLVSDISDPREYHQAVQAIQRLRERFDPLMGVDRNGKKTLTPANENAAYLSFRDYYDVQACRLRWREANAIYFADNDAWQHSNERLADIHDVLFDIARRNGMVIMPKTGSFNIDEYCNFGAIRPFTQPQDGESGGQ